MDPKDFEEALKDIDKRLDRLKALYEMYFQGIERIEPTVPRKRVDRMLRQLRKEQPRTTHLRFKYQTLLQRYVTLTTYWGRVARQIEEGTYYRDVQKARRKRQHQERLERAEAEREAREPAQQVYELDLDGASDLSALLEDPELDAAIARIESSPSPSATRAPEKVVLNSDAPAAAPAKKGVFGRPKERPASTYPAATSQQAPSSAGGGASPPARPPIPPRTGAPPKPPRTGPPPVPRSGASGGPDDARMRRIYEDYVAARRSNNERTDNVRFENMQRSIQQMVPKLEQKHRGKKIDFEVVVRDGRVGLKPVPK